MYLTQTHISPLKVVTQLPKPNKDLSISLFLVIDDNSTKIWKLSSNGFMLLVQAILPYIKDLDKFDELELVALAPPTYVLRVWIESLHICMDRKYVRVITTK